MDIETIKHKIYESDGYSFDLKMSNSDLQKLRELVSDQYYTVINESYPELLPQFKAKGIERYHELSHLVDHSRIWPKLNRCLKQESCDEIKKLDFFKMLHEYFAPFTLGRVVYEREVEYDRDEMYWRIVRPHSPRDVGTLHADAWFHICMDIRSRCFPPGGHALKIWLPLFVEVGKNGLAIVENSHKMQWDYRVEDIENTFKPRLNVDEKTIPTKLLEVPAGNILIFNEDLVHVGAYNSGETIRLSLEITLLKGA